MKYVHACTRIACVEEQHAVSFLQMTESPGLEEAVTGGGSRRIHITCMPAVEVLCGPIRDSDSPSISWPDERQSYSSLVRPSPSSPSSPALDAPPGSPSIPSCHKSQSSAHTPCQSCSAKPVYGQQRFPRRPRWCHLQLASGKASNAVRLASCPHERCN
jgi:hypothetical protein